MNLAFKIAHDAIGWAVFSGGPATQTHKLMITPQKAIEFFDSHVAANGLPVALDLTHYETPDDASTPTESVDSESLATIHAANTALSDHATKQGVQVRHRTFHKKPYTEWLAGRDDCRQLRAEFIGSLPFTIWQLSLSPGEVTETVRIQTAGEKITSGEHEV